MKAICFVSTTHATSTSFVELLILVTNNYISELKYIYSLLKVLNIEIDEEVRTTQSKQVVKANSDNVSRTRYVLNVGGECKLIVLHREKFFTFLAKINGF